MAIWKTKWININKDITYFEFSGMIVDKAGLNILSRSVSMNVLGPVQNQQLQ